MIDRPLPMTQPPILELQQVTKQFANNAMPAVKDVTLSLVQGDLLGVLGPSGCGKTTLLRLIAGFEQPESGRIAVAGRTMVKPGLWVPPEQRSLGIVFQDFALFPHLTVAQNVQFGLQSLERRLVQQRGAAAIALVGLEGMETRYPHELSGGQQQRVALARALAPRPPLILLDEPLSSLDVQLRLHLRQEIRAILKATATSAIWVTHDQEEALAISDQIAVMEQGKIAQIGVPEAIYHAPASQFVAEFVTQANFLPAYRQGDTWKTEMGRFEANDLDTDDLDTGCLMIRPEHLMLQPEADAPAIIQDRQFLGHEYRYCVRLPSGKQLYARTAMQTHLAVGTRVQLRVAEPKLRIFPSLLGSDQRSGRSATPAPGVSG
ncbi:MAG TPA: ABC transporter ATP-binding protein [Coleofasciculaceae cyanobacterium]